MGYADLVTRTDRAVQGHLGGVTVSYKPKIGAAVPVTGVFSRPFVLAEGQGGEAGVEQTAPAVFFRLSDLPKHPDGDDPRLTIDGTVFKVKSREPDGMGGITLTLQRVGP